MKLVCFEEVGSLQLPQSFINFFSPTPTVIPTPRAHALGEFLKLALGFKNVPAVDVRFSIDTPLENSLAIRGTHTATVIPYGPQNAAADGFFYVGGQGLPFGMALKTADCLAVALAAQLGSKVYAALVHAGWRGYTGGIHFEAVEKLAQAASQDGFDRKTLVRALEVVIAPAIFGACYPCGSDVREAIATHERSRLAPLFAAHSGALHALYSECSDIPPALGHAKAERDKIYPDLQSMMCVDLTLLGLLAENITVFRENTFGHAFLRSYRYACNTGIDTRGRFVTHLLGFQKA